MAKNPKSLVIGYADCETEHEGDLKARGVDVHIEGNVVVDQYGNTPRIDIKCCGLVVAHPDGQEKEFMYHSVKEFLQGLIDNSVDRCYFHNLKFDDSFIASYMRNDEVQLEGCTVTCRSRLINGMGQVFSDVLVFKGKRSKKNHRKNHTCEIWDSMKIWTSDLESLGKSFGVIKGGTTGGSKATEVGCSREMEEYCLQDCRVIAKAMGYYFDRCKEETKGTRPYGWMTAGSTAYHLCMMHLKESMTVKSFKETFPPCNEESGFPEWLRDGYKGAVPLLDPAIRNRLLKDVDVFDINSQHPDKMANYPMPMGRPITIKVKTIDRLMELKSEGKLWVAKVRMVADVKEGHRATYLLKRRGPDGETLAWHINDLDGMNPSQVSYQVITNVDMDYILRDYDVRYIEVLDAIGFRSGIESELAPFVKKWYSIKEEAAERKDKPMKAFAKLVLNSLYGKFGTNPEHKTSEYEFIDDKIKVIESKVDIDKSPLYLPIAMFITAYSRDVISKTCNAIGWKHVAYTDTDSVHVHGLNTEETMKRIKQAGFKIHPTDLGAYDYESRWRYAIYVRNKGYFHFGRIDIKTGELTEENEIKMAGANGFEGFTCVEDVLNKELKGTQRRGCRVRGGTLIMEKEVTIDTRIDAALVTKRKIRGMTQLMSDDVLDRRISDIWEEYGVEL